MTTVGALVGGVKVRTRPGLVGLPPGEGPVPPVPARILASLSATEGPVDVPAACCGAGVGPAVVGCTAVGQNKINKNMGCGGGCAVGRDEGCNSVSSALVHTSSLHICLGGDFSWEERKRDDPTPLSGVASRALPCVKRNLGQVDYRQQCSCPRAVNTRCLYMYSSIV